MWLLAAALAALAAIVAVTLLLDRPEEAPVAGHVDHAARLASYQAEDITRLAITLRTGDSWSARQTGGTLVLEDDPNYQVDASTAAALLNSARIIGYEDVLADDPAVYQGRLEEFGLVQPRLVAEVSFADGAAWTLRIGDAVSLSDSSAYYMLIDGDQRLFALDKGTAESLMVEKALLHPVEQPILHKARFDRITFAEGDGSIRANWTLQGAIGGNAQDRWLMTAPVQYPADGEAMSTLMDNLANLRLGAYVGAATPENRTCYGFDAPRFVLQIHQAAGSTGTVTQAGAYDVTDWPEADFTLTVGGAKNDQVDYMLVGDSIYLGSHFTLNVFMEMQPASTLSRYTVPVALGNLEQLIVQRTDGAVTYTLTRAERVAENNELVTDAQGNVLYDVTCMAGGQEIPWAAFESAYNELLKVTVSGELPQGWQTAEAPHTTFVFQAATGETYTVALSSFDAMHDAVLVNGQALFYLIKGGMAFEPV